MSNKAGLWEAEWRTAVKKIERQNAELTKLKADVVKLRAAAKEVHDRMHYLLEPDEGGELDMGHVRQCVDDYLGMLARALEETKP